VKKSVLLIVLMNFLLVMSYGCATKEYVKEQIDALRAECCGKNEAAERAEAAARKAEAAAKKAEKAFELQQNK
jgi:hypothetical protein